MAACSSWDLKQALCWPSSAADADAASEEEELALCFRQLTPLSPHICAQLTSLTSLNLSFNALRNLPSLSALSRLQQLNVSHNRLTSLDHLPVGLTQLLAGHNSISSITAALADGGLPQVQFLALHANSVSTAADVAALSQLTRLKHLTLRGNPCCKQECWQDATIALLPSLQALDSEVVSTERRAAATACAGVWTAAGQQAYSSSNSCAGSECGGGADDAGHGSSSSSRLSAGGSRRSSGSAGRLRPRVQAAAPPDDSVSIKDATSLLPCITRQPLKPSSLVRRVSATQPSNKYQYSRAKPLRVLNKQMYPAPGAGAGSAAVLIHSDGSASLTWPEGGMAATLDPEAAPLAAGSAASSGSSLSAQPIQGYRLLAMYRSITGVAASFDSTGGGFVQWPNGCLMLVWDKKTGTAYGADGRVTHRWTNSNRKPPGVLTEDITARLDEHLSIRFSAGSHDLQLAFTCEGCQALLSQQHGPVLPEREAVAVPAVAAPAECPAADVAAAAAAADLPGGDAMQALLARARALMDATPAPAPSAPSPPELQCTAPSPAVEAVPDAHDADEAAAELQAMMARARAAMAGLQL